MIRYILDTTSKIRKKNDRTPQAHFRHERSRCEHLILWNCEVARERGLQRCARWFIRTESRVVALARVGQLLHLRGEHVCAAVDGGEGEGHVVEMAEALTSSP